MSRGVCILYIRIMHGNKLKTPTTCARDGTVTAVIGVDSVFEWIASHFKVISCGPHLKAGHGC